MAIAIININLFIIIIGVKGFYIIYVYIAKIEESFSTYKVIFLKTDRAFPIEG